MPRNLTTRLPAIALLLLAGTAGVYFAARAGGATAGLLAALGLACAVALVLRTEPASVESLSVSRLFDGALLGLPAIVTVYFSFDSGGYFPASPAFAAIVLAIVLVLRVTLIDEPFAGFSRPLSAAVAALGLYTVWILASALWSDTPARALIEFERAFAYLLLLVLFGSIPRTSQRLRWMAGGLALGTLVVALAALATRLYPDSFPTTPNLGPQELSYPLGYSNALGMLCVLGALMALYFATSVRQSRAARVAGAAALPVLSTVVYLSLSRGPVAAAVVGIAAFVLLGRPRGLVTGLIAAVPAAAIAVVSAYRHELLTSPDPQTAAAAAQGHRVATVVALCTVAAGALRLLLTPLDSRLERASLPSSLRRPVVVSAWVVAALAVLALALATGAPGRISDQYHRFVETAQAGPNQDIRASVFDPSNRGLLDNWSVGLRAFGNQPLHGQGAGMYESYWNRERPAKQASYDVTDAHSLYIEALGELGAVGFVLLIVFLAAILLSLAPLRRGPNRSLYAALFAAALAWAVHAGVDWDWETPAVTAWLFAFGGAALAAHRRSEPRDGPRQGARVTVGILLLLSTVAPGLLLASQRQLNDGLDALHAGNCTRAVDRATASIATLDVRPEPYEVIALCQAKRGRTGFAIQAMAKAAKRDPGNWRYAYGLAVLQGGAGIDPRPELVRALHLNPQRAEIRDLLATVPKGTGVAWDLSLLSPSGAIVTP
jgi:O-antigen ligase